MLQKWFVCVALLALVPVHLLINIIQDTADIDYIPCDEGWFLFGEKCYKLFGGDKANGKQLSWDDASHVCKDNGGYLATIQSKEVEDFLLTFLLLESDIKFWIGLHDKRNESHYEWLDGTKFNYSNWDFNEPNDHMWRQDQDCVYVILQAKSISLMKWHDLPCKDKSAYLCQVDKGKQMKMSHDPRVCPRENGGGWKFGHSCFNIVKENMTWGEAETYCQDQYKGHLVTILHFQTEYFLKYITENFNTDVWIGIKIRKDQIRQKFSSGWPVVRTNWLKTPPVFEDGTCVVLRNGQWELVPCVEKYPFICEVSTVSPPVLRKITEEENSKCPQRMKDWLDLGGEYCYFIDTESNYDCLRASVECSRRGSSLASFHSQEELLALAPHARNALYRNYGIWIGLYGTPDIENKFEWFDGSAVDFTYWSIGEPSENQGACVELLLPSMKWNDIPSQKKMGYICAVKKLSLNADLTEQVCECTSTILYKIMTGVSVCILFVVIILSVLLNYFRPWKTEAKVRRQKPTTLNVPSNGIFLPDFHFQKSRFDEYEGGVYENDSDNEYEEMD